MPEEAPVTSARRAVVLIERRSSPGPAPGLQRAHAAGTPGALDEARSRLRRILSRCARASAAPQPRPVAAIDRARPFALRRAGVRQRLLVRFERPAGVLREEGLGEAPVLLRLERASRPHQSPARAHERSALLEQPLLQCAELAPLGRAEPPARL